MVEKVRRPSKILVVEDEPNVAQVMRARLESYAYEVCHIVSTGLDAIHFAEEMVPDIVIMDIKIKGDMEGIESAHIIRSQMDVPVIFVSSHADEGLLKRAQAAEPFDYIMKPYEGRQLQISIEMALVKHRLELERKHLVRDLTAALAKVKTLTGLLPICASCKKIRDDKGYWNQLERYFQQNSDVEFTHGICPDCAKILYPDILLKP